MFAFKRWMAKILQDKLLYWFTPCFKKLSTFYALNNWVKREPIIVILDKQNPEEIRNTRLWICPQHLRNVTALPCKMQTSFSSSKLYRFHKKDGLENSRWLYAVRQKLNFRQAASRELRWHVDWSSERQHSVVDDAYAVLAFNTCLNYNVGQCQTWWPPRRI